MSHIMREETRDLFERSNTTVEDRKASLGPWIHNVEVAIGWCRNVYSRLSLSFSLAQSAT